MGYERDGIVQRFICDEKQRDIQRNWLKQINYFFDRDRRFKQTLSEKIDSASLCGIVGMPRYYGGKQWENTQ